MQQYPGLFIVLEGSDGSGKGTQFRLLKERLEAVGHDVATFDFPRYDEPSSHFVRRYLNGDYGPANAVSPYTASLFYALDRYEAAPEVRKALNEGKIVLSNRYVGSNMAHQGSKFQNEAEQRGFFVWADSLEYQLLGIPRPDLNIFLRVPAQISFKLIANKKTRGYTDKTHDEHEADIDHLKNSVATYDQLCRLFPKDFMAIECSQGENLLSIPEINDRIWAVLIPRLKNTTRHRPQSKTVRLDEEPSAVPAEPIAKLSDIKTDKSSPASLKLRGISLLAAQRVAKIPGMTQRLPELVIKNAKMGRWYTPPKLSRAVGQDYQAALQKIAKLHQEMAAGLGKFKKSPASAREDNFVAAKEALNLIWPLATLTDMEMSLPVDGLSELLTYLAASQLPEDENILHTITKQANPKQPKIPNTTKLVKNPPIQSALEDIISQLSSNLSDSDEAVQLSKIWPSNELELLNELAYEPSALSRDKLAESIDSWSYHKKIEALSQIAKQEPLAFNTVLPKVRFRLDLLSDGLSLWRLLAHGILSEVKIQTPTVRYGYEIPDVIEKTGLEDLYMECFDISLELYSKLQSDHQGHVAGYAVLLGHKVRWQATVSFADFKAAKTYIGHRPLWPMLQAKISETYPILNELTLATPATSPPLKTTHPKLKISAKNNSSTPKPASRRSQTRRGRGRPPKSAPK